MKRLLADESVHGKIIEALREEEFEVDAIKEESPGISDEEVLDLANQKDALLITQDKDFGTLTYRSGKASNGIILIRRTGMAIAGVIKVLLQLLRTRGAGLFGKFTVINKNKVRIRDME